MATTRRPLPEKMGVKSSALSILWKAHGERVSCGTSFSSEACGVMYLHCMKLDQQPSFSPGDELAVPDQDAASSSAQLHIISLQSIQSTSVLNLDTMGGPSSRRLYTIYFQYREGAI